MWGRAPYRELAGGEEEKQPGAGHHPPLPTSCQPSSTRAAFTQVSLDENLPVALLLLPKISSFYHGHPCPGPCPSPGLTLYWPAQLGMMGHPGLSLSHLSIPELGSVASSPAGERSGSREQRGELSLHPHYMLQLVVRIKESQNSIR